MDKRLFLIPIAVILTALSNGCIGKPASESNTAAGSETARNFKKEVSLPLELGDEAIVNPFMGFAPDADSKKAAEQCSLVYVDVTFRELEPEEGVFDFQSIEKENTLDRWKAAGKHVVLRFLCDKPSDRAHRDIPDWLYDKINGDGKAYDISYGKGFSPNYSNDLFIEYHAKAIQALGEHFGKDTFVSYIEFGSLGHWGEWHVKYEDGIPRIPSKDIREKYITPYLDAFPQAKFLMRRPFETAKAHGFGLYNDMAGEPKSSQEWLDWLKNGGDYSQAKEKDALVPMADAWQTAPIGGEFNSLLTMDEMMKSKLSQTKALLSASHTTFLGPKCPISSNSSKDNDTDYHKGVEDVVRSIGYRIGITQADISERDKDGNAEIELTWTNKGTAPLYFDLPVNLYVLDQNNAVVTTAAVELKTSKLLPENTLKTDTKFSYGGLQTGYKLCVGIIDPMTNKPAVKLINKAEYLNNMTVLYTRGQ